MVRFLRPPRGLVLPIVLAGLMALLGALQYRWLGQVSEADREQLRRSMAQRAAEFAGDFDTELARVYAALHSVRTAAAARDAASVAESFELWRSRARFPGLVRQIYLASGHPPRPALQPLDVASRTFKPPVDPWPAALQPVHARFGAFVSAPPTTPQGTQVFTVALLPTLPEVPALVIPLMVPGPGLPTAAGPTRGTAERPGMFAWLGSMGDWLIVELDREYIHTTVFPALASRQFPETGPGEYRLEVTGEAGQSLFARGLSAGQRLKAEQADAVAPLFALRTEIVRSMLSSGDVLTFRTDARRVEPGKPNTGGAEGSVAVLVERRSNAVAMGGTPSVGAQLHVSRLGWRLVVQHPLGSVDAAVTQGRRRNLYLGFGILSVLAAGILLVVINARRSAQLAARQMDFVATVTHELRTPLSVIRVAGHNLSSGVVADSDQTKQYGALIENEGRRLSEMVEQVLDYAGLTGRRPLQAVQAVDVRHLVEELVRSNDPLFADAGVQVEVQPSREDEAAAVVSGDQGAIRRAVQNLLSNAAKHGADGRWIGVGVTTGTTRRGAEVRVSVSDRGCGIDAADLPHVFEPFYRGKTAVERQVHGNGLGLSLVKRIAEAHGGTVSIASTPGRGTTVTLHLPHATGAVDQDALAEPSPTEPVPVR